MYNYIFSFHLRPDDVYKKSKDVAFEEAEFGLEDVEALDSIEAEETDSHIEGIMCLKTEEDCRRVSREAKCLAFISQLKLLAKINVQCCKTCNTKEIQIEESFTGSALYFKWVSKFRLNFHFK